MNGVARFFFALLTMCFFIQTAPGADSEIELGTGTLKIDIGGRAVLEMHGTGVFQSAVEPFCAVETGQGRLYPEEVIFEKGLLNLRFPGGGTCSYAVRTGDGFAVFELATLEFGEPMERLRHFSLPVPGNAAILGTLNAASAGPYTVALSAAEPNVHALTRTFGRREGDRDGCSHTMAVTDRAKTGTGAAVFTATCNDTPGGWSVSSRDLPSLLNLNGLKAIRAWVHGDGKGELLKIQLTDGREGARDTYIPITFEGWRQITVSDAPYDTLLQEQVSGLNLYYNGLPAGETVICRVDHIEAVLEREGGEVTILLEDFEPASSWWSAPVTTLQLETLAGKGVKPARFGLLAAPRERFMEVMERFEEAAGLPCPRPGGVWNKRSPWIKRSYLFITRFNESQLEPVIAMARRGGFDMILMGQESWAKATGHYDINLNHFPGGLEALARTFRRFREAGFHAGLHFLGPSIYPPDPYLAPVPDLRLVRDAEVPLATDVDDNTGVLLTEAPPQAFPVEDGGYTGEGTVVQVDDELISYGERSVQEPFGLFGCKRGLLGTMAASHVKGRPVRHLKRSYGYFLFDMDTSLLDEVSSNFARVANACDIDMIYFDGSERLQGDHWYYNAKLHKAFFDKLARKDILIQASSFSHYSWHILARSASADGHGDLKGYLDERSPAFDSFKQNGMPLDIGWYYGYDTSCTPDMYEYILGATIGYDSSMSFQVSLEAASRHPFTGEILDLIARYEGLRLSGRVPEAMRARLRVDPVLAGQKTPEERAGLAGARREYRLLGENGKETFQRVVYEPWNEIITPEDQTWPVQVISGPARTGFQVHVQSGPWREAGPSYHAPEAITLESFDDLAPYAKNPPGGPGIPDLPNGTFGATLESVTHHIRLGEANAREGGCCAVYTAESARDDAVGWSVFGKTFSPPLDLSGHRAIGFWLRGDGKGGQFKLQLLDGAGAADFYIANDYEGWRYHQLIRPQPDPIDYGQVRTLNFYYNGLPGDTIVTCAIDGVKALPAADIQAITDPWFEVEGKRLDWKGTLTAGQYLFLWPGEPARCFGPGFIEPVPGTATMPAVSLAEGTHTARFGCANTPVAPVRVRATLQLRESYPMPSLPTP